MVHLTAPTIHAGFNGNITLEGDQSRTVPPEARSQGTRICQFIFERLESAPEQFITTQFQGQKNPIGGKS